MRGDNPVLMTMELVLEVVAEEGSRPHSVIASASEQCFFVVVFWVGTGRRFAPCAQGGENKTRN